MVFMVVFEFLPNSDALYILGGWKPQRALLPPTPPAQQLVPRPLLSYSLAGHPSHLVH